MVAAVQTVSQLEHLYGRAAEAVLENFSTKVFLGGAISLADAKRASELSGQCTVSSVSVTTSGEAGSAWSGTVSRTKTPVPRPVLLPDEIARPPENPILGLPATVFLPGRPPFYAYFPPAYESPPLVAALGGVSSSAEGRGAACPPSPPDARVDTLGS